MTLLPAEAEIALQKARRAKHGQLYRAHHLWKLRNCELVATEEEGGLGYVLKETPTEAEPYYPASASQVELTPAEMVTALAAGQLVKWGELKAAHYVAQAAQASRQRSQAQRAVGYEQVYGWALRQAQVVADRRVPAFSFVVDGHNTHLFDLLCLYHAGDKRFETLGEEWGFGPLSLDKGIGLFGGVGRGKTILQEVFRHSPARPYGLVSARKVSEVFSEDLTANEGKRPLISSTQKLYRGLGDTRALCFDDLAREENKHQHMGNWVYPMQRVLLDRYDAVQRGHLPLWATHLTSNNPLEPADAVPGMPSLTELYGEPAIDRLYEMCNMLTLGGPSRRG